MSDVVDALVLDLVEWVAKEPRTYSSVMDAWRTSCPRLTVWEDAVDRDLVRTEARGENGVYVIVSDRGRELLKASHRAPAA